MKVDVSIKFNSVEEYKEIKKTLKKQGYKNDKHWNKRQIEHFERFGDKTYYVYIDYRSTMTIYNHTCGTDKVYNSLEEFLED